MRLSQALEDKKMDVRIADRHIADGVISEKELKAHLSDLEDCQDKLEYLDEESES